MFDTGTHLYAGMPKTGTTSSVVLLEQEYGPNRIYKAARGKHTALRMIPYFVREERVTVGTIRPPVDWYVSAYHYSRTNKEKLNAVWGNGDDTFYSTLYGMTHPGKVTGTLEHAIGSIPGPSGAGEYFKMLDVGFWSWHCIWCYMSTKGEWLTDVLIDMRYLIPSWTKVLGKEVPNIHTNQPKVKAEPKVTSEMIDWVYNADGKLSRELYDEAWRPKHDLFVKL